MYSYGGRRKARLTSHTPDPTTDVSLGPTRPTRLGSRPLSWRVHILDQDLAILGAEGRGLVAREAHEVGHTHAPQRVKLLQQLLLEWVIPENSRRENSEARTRHT